MVESQTTKIYLNLEPGASPVHVFQCQKSWDQLRASDSGNERLCDHCNQTVVRVVDADGFQHAVAGSRCVMVVGFSDKSDEPKHFVGQTSESSYQVNDTKLAWGG